MSLLLPHIILIAALDKNRGIGMRGELLFRISADLRRFKDRTTGAWVLMGSTTFATLPGPLSGRRLIVLSQKHKSLPNALVATSLSEAFAIAAAERAPLYVAGGAQVYSQALPFADELDLTEIDATKEADAWFPQIPPRFTEISREHHDAENGTPAYDFVRYHHR